MELSLKTTGAMDSQQCDAASLFGGFWKVKTLLDMYHYVSVMADLGKDRLPDAFVMGVGTGGTLIGVGQCFHALNPACLLVGMEPDESCTILCGEVHHHKIEGISDGFIPGIFERHRDEVNQMVAVSSLDAITEMEALARRGYLVGPSSGANIVAARRLKQLHPEFRTIVTVLCDEGEKYLTEFYLHR